MKNFIIKKQGQGETDKEKLQSSNDNIYEEFYNQEREEINDAMYCHWQSVSEEMFEAVCERMDYLQSNMPDEV